jgi:SAM-dependent methyltransferase
MAQNVYDWPDFFRGYSQLPRSVKGLDGAPEWHAVRALLPDLGGHHVVDLGCGFGWFARWARQHGAESVLAVDISNNMIARAQADTADKGIEYRIADLDALELPDATFDLAYSSLALHYVADFTRLVRMVHRALKPDTHFVFTIEHPVFMAAAHPAWTVDEDGSKTWPVNGYFSEGVRTTDWFTSGVVKHHRTIGTTLNALIAAGFALRHVEEFSPNTEQIAAWPELAEELERPMMLIVSAQR